MAVDELHDQEMDALGLVGVVGGDNVALGRLQICQPRLDFLVENNSLSERDLMNCWTGRRSALAGDAWQGGPLADLTGSMKTASAEEGSCRLPLVDCRCNLQMAYSASIIRDGVR